MPSSTSSMRVTNLGAIVHVMVGRRTGLPFGLAAGQYEILSSSQGATFVAADPRGNFGTRRGYQANSFSNSTSTWVGGLVFCPFFEGKKFKYLVETGFFTGAPYSAIISPDPSVGYIATVVGWF